MQAIWILMLLIIPLVLADDIESGIVLGGDATGLIVESEGWKYGRIYSDFARNSNSRTPPVKFYDVIVKVNKPQTQIMSLLSNLGRQTYAPGSIVSAKLLIDLQTEWVPQQDGILQYTLISPDGKELPYNIQTIREGDHLKEITYQIPLDSIPGTYGFKVIWTVEDLEPIISVDNFQVSNNKLAWQYILLAGMMLLFISKRRKKKRENDE